MIRDKVYSSKVREFELMLQGHFQCEHLSTISNATSGILGTFYALGLGNSEIITTPLTWLGAITPLKVLGNKIVFADIEEPTLTLNPDTLEQFITPNTRAVFSADFLGYPCRLDKIRSICDKYEVVLIHDAASSFGSLYKENYSGYYAHVAIYSFGRNKPLTTGEGGCLIVDSKTLFCKIGRAIFHPERLNMQLNQESQNYLNTSIHPLAVEHGLKTFKSQVETLKMNQSKSISWYKNYPEFRPKLLDSVDPNYYKTLVKIPKNLKDTALYFNQLPFQLLPESKSINWLKYYKVL